MTLSDPSWGMAVTARIVDPGIVFQVNEVKTRHIDKDHFSGGGQSYTLEAQSLSCVWLFTTPWTAACQASLFFTISPSLLKLISIERVKDRAAIQTYMRPKICLRVKDCGQCWENLTRQGAEQSMTRYPSLDSGLKSDKKKKKNKKKPGEKILNRRRN